MKYLNLFIPNFLQDIDNRLMLQLPHIWRTRIHFVAFYGLIAWILLFFVGLFYPLSMYDISRTPYAVEEVKRVSFLFLLICGFFSLIYWWQQVAKFRILAANWYHSFMECALFFVGVFMLWQAVNAFQNGLDTNMAYRVGRKISVSDKEKLYANNFYLPGFINYNKNDQFKNDIELNNLSNSISGEYYATAEKLLEVYHNRIHRQGVLQDSQFFIKKDFKITRNTNRDRYAFLGYSNDNYVYRHWKDSINQKAQKYIKPTVEWEDVWNEETNKTKKKWVSHPFDSYNSWVLDSIYQHFSSYEKSQVDSARNESVNAYIDEKRKQLDYKLPLHFSELMRHDIPKVLDTCSNLFFNNQQWTYLDILKFQSYDFEKQFKQQQLLSVLSPNEKIKYRDYLAEIILMMPMYQRTPIINMEVGLYYRRDSLTHDFLSQLSPRNKRIYEEMIAFFINNTFDKQDVATKAGNYKWNKQTRKYSEIEKYASRGFLDTVFFYADSIIAKKEKSKYNFVVIYNVLNNGLYNSVFPDVYWSMENWKNSKDTFFLEMKTKRIEGEYGMYVNRKMRRDSIPIDSVFKWKVEENLTYIGREIKLELDSSIINCYKKYRDTKITDQDSTFLDNVYTRCGYLRDSSEHSRLFFHANAYYLYLADITINKSRAFLTDWNPLYLSTSNKLAIIVLSFLMFFTTLANSNLFTAVFVAFFINFFNNTIFNLGQNFQEIDKSKQTFWLFGLLAILALLTAVNVLFRKFKLPIIYLLINIQLFALLGIFVWLFDSQTIEQQSNYGYLAIIFWGLMVWKYRSYLALPSKK